ncbi:glycosyltransferase, partial [Klebsiella pneumoniae]|uniref:glycosyltransferase family 2 protein n=1 Tax=Klebsiella pneumoniae TaxID=573 RepID=UPI001372DAFF|nr:glycosyltransferase [Klebsiella pneumoniae]
MDCLLSIVIPVYNTEKYLPSCLNSLLDQDLEATKFEIICVDDGSTDSCPTILDEYA